jgi:hypothetical protein
MCGAAIAIAPHSSVVRSSNLSTLLWIANAGSLTSCVSQLSLTSVCTHPMKEDCSLGFKRPGEWVVGRFDFNAALFGWSSFSHLAVSRQVLDTGRMRWRGGDPYDETLSFLQFSVKNGDAAA